MSHRVCGPVNHDTASVRALEFQIARNVPRGDVYRSDLLWFVFHVCLVSLCHLFQIFITWRRIGQEGMGDNSVLFYFGNSARSEKMLVLFVARRTCRIIGRLRSWIVIALITRIILPCLSEF